MKNIFFSEASLVLFSYKTSVTDKTLDRGAQEAMKGNWVISSVIMGSEVLKWVFN
jgi:hypothetical protein